MTGDVWNPIYVAYSRSQGRAPCAQLVYDKARYPGACMMPFMLWVQR